MVCEEHRCGVHGQYPHPAWRLPSSRAPLPTVHKAQTAMFSPPPHPYPHRGHSPPGCPKLSSLSLRRLTKGNGQWSSGALEINHDPEAREEEKSPTVSPSSWEELPCMEGRGQPAKEKAEVQGDAETETLWGRDPRSPPGEQPPPQRDSS